MCSSQHTCAAVVVRHTLLLYKQCNTARITVQQYIVIGSKALHFPVHKMVVDSSHDLLTDGDSISRLNPKLFRVLNRVSWADLEIENFVSAKWNVAEIDIFYLERGEADVISWSSCSVRLQYENLLVPIPVPSLCWSLDPLISWSLVLLFSWYLDIMPFAIFHRIFENPGWLGSSDLSQIPSPDWIQNYLEC